jgi:hypothetical protein
LPLAIIFRAVGAVPLDHRAKLIYNPTQYFFSDP